MTTPNPELTPAELQAVHAEVDHSKPAATAGNVLAALADVFDQAALRQFDAHVHVTGVLTEKGKTASINAVLVPAGVGDEVSFTVAVSA